MVPLLLLFTYYSKIFIFLSLEKGYKKIVMVK